ncbi:MAG: hypothetical protein WCA39_18655 [Nitrososphaeraceae archaeon]
MHLRYLHYFGNESCESILEAYAAAAPRRRQQHNKNKDKDKSKPQTSPFLTRLVNTFHVAIFSSRIIHEHQEKSIRN